MATTKNNWSTDRISNVIISNLITYDQEYPWHLLIIYSSEEQYDYFLDCWSGDDEYTYLYDYYENKYPEYNQELKHYGK